MGLPKPRLSHYPPIVHVMLSFVLSFGNGSYVMSFFSCGFSWWCVGGEASTTVPMAAQTMSLPWPIVKVYFGQLRSIIHQAAESHTIPCPVWNESVSRMQYAAE